MFYISVLLVLLSFCYQFFSFPSAFLFFVLLFYLRSQLKHVKRLFYGFNLSEGIIRHYYQSQPADGRSLRVVRLANVTRNRMAEGMAEPERQALAEALR